MVKNIVREVSSTKQFIHLHNTEKVSAFGVGGLSQNVDTADALEGGRGLSQNDDMLTILREGVVELKHRADNIL